MKIAHLSDIHIRKSPTRHVEYREVFKNLYKSLKKEKPHRIVIVGDLFHDYIDLQGEAVVLASEFLNELTTIAPVIITRGNHDIRKKALTRTDSVEAVVSTMKNDKIFYLNETGFFDDDSIGVTWAVWKHGERNNSPWRKRTKEYNKDNVVIDLFHDPVRGCRTATGFEMNKKTYLRSTELKGEYSFLGDIHKLQYLNDEKTIAYPSSLIAQDFGEGDDKFHGYLLWDMETGVAEEISIKNPYSYKSIIVNRFTDFTELDFDIDNITKHLRIRIVWQTLPSMRNNENQRQVEGYIKEYCTIKKSKIGFITNKNEFYEEDVIDKIDDELNMDDLSLQEVQHEIFKDYLEKIGVDEETVEKIIELDDEISDNIETEDFTNIKWSIIKMSGKNFMSYEDIEIDWRDTDGLFQITGLNTAGKTTIMKLMTYILYNKSKETETRMKAGDSRYVNNILPVLFCEGTMVIDVNGQYYGIKRRTEIEKNKAGEIKSAPTTLSYYILDTADDVMDDDVNGIESLGEKDRIQTQKTIVKAIGSYENFMRVVMTTSDTLNEILSGDRAKFIDALLYDSGLDIFDLKLNEFKEYQKKIKALPRVTCNIESTRDNISELENDVVVVEDMINEYESTLIPNIKDSIAKGEEYVEKLTKKLYNIDDDIYNLNVDQVQDEIKMHIKEIDVLKERELFLTQGISELKETFNEEEYNKLQEQHRGCIKKINELRIEIKETEQKIITERNNKDNLNTQIAQLINEGGKCKEEIVELKQSKTCPTCGQLMTEEHQEHINAKIKEIEVKMFDDIAPQIKAKKSHIPELNNKINDLGLSIDRIKSDIEILNEGATKYLEDIGVLEIDRQEVVKRKELQASLDKLPIEIKNFLLKIDILNKNIELYEKSKKQIEENHKIEGGISKAKQRLNELKSDFEVLKDRLYSKKTEKGNHIDTIRELNELIVQYIEQEKQDDVINIYKKCIHRDGIPTQLLINSAIPKINTALGMLLDNVPFTVWLDSLDLKLKLAYNNRMDAVIDAISASGKERTFSAIALKFALNQINTKSKPTILLLDEVMGKLTEDSVEEFVMVLHAIKDNMEKVLVVEHNHEIDPDYLIEVTKNEDSISELKIN